MTATEAKPDGFEVIEHTVCGQRAVISSGGGAVFLAQRLQPLRTCSDPITALCLVDAERGERAPRGYEQVKATTEAERSTFSRSLWFTRKPADPRDTTTLQPIGRVTILAPGRNSHGGSSSNSSSAPTAPPGFERLESGTLGSRNSGERFLAFERILPCGLLSTPLKATIVDALLRHNRPKPYGHLRRPAAGTAASSHADGYGEADDEEEDEDDDGGGVGEGGSPSSSHSHIRELPSALPHFCLPQGAQIRLTCPWPTAHDFALTDRLGARLYGCCLTVWEPMEYHSNLYLMRPVRTIDERLRMEVRQANGHKRPLPPKVEWEDKGWGDGGSSTAPSIIRTAFCGEHKVVLAPKPEAEEGSSTTRSGIDPTGMRTIIEASEAAAAAEDGHGQQAARAVLNSASSQAATTATSATASPASASKKRDVFDLAAAANPNKRMLLTHLIVSGTALYTPTCLCVLSRHPFLSSLRTWLCELYRHSLSRADVPIERLITSLLWECPLPRPTVSVSLTLGRDIILFERPAPASALPVHELRLSSLLHALTPSLVLKLFAAACVEQKLILVSQYNSQLTSAAEALLSLTMAVRLAKCLHTSITLSVTRCIRLPSTLSIRCIYSLI